MSVTATALRELHRIHQQLADLRERLERGPKQIRAREAQVAQCEEKLAKSQAEGKAARMAVDQKQLLLKSGEIKIKDLKAKLNACGTNREYQALRDQIAADEMAGSVLADEILEAMEVVDETKRHTIEAESVRVRVRDELAKLQESVRGQQESLLSDVKRLEADLKAAEAALPPDFQVPYRRVVKAKGQDAMSQVDGESCGGCNQQLTPNVLNELAMAKAIFCRTCGRLLYLPEDRSPGRR